MSQTVPPRVQGEIEAPNPLELFWEKNKRVVIFGAVAAVTALAINYLVQYQTRRATAEKWSALAQASGLDNAYTDLGDRWAAVQTRLQQIEAQAAGNPNAAQQLNFQRQMTLQGFFMELDARQLANLDEQVKGADVAELEQIVASGDDRAPLALWVLANRAYFEKDYDQVRARLDTLRTRFPEHFLCRSSEYPVQWRAEVPKEDDEPGEDAPPKPDSKPELVPPQPGSEVDLLLARVDKEQEFRAEHGRFYEPVAPTSEQTVVFEIENAGTIKIKLFSDRVPEHAAKFLELAQAGFWTDMRIHEIRREPQPNEFNRSVPDEFAFGWTSTKNEDDRTKWLAGEIEEEHKLDWEKTDLSHFPGTVAVEAAGAGKSQVERIVINGDDAAAQADGTRVIVGRVIEGMDVVQDIVNGGFADATAVGIGRGKPEESYVIKSVKVE